MAYINGTVAGEGWSQGHRGTIQIPAAQEQALNTRWREAEVYHTRQDTKWLYKDAPEVMQHITAGCKMQAGKANLELHNQVTGIVYRKYCAEYGLDVPGLKWVTYPKLIENDDAKIL